MRLWKVQWPDLINEHHTNCTPLLMSTRYSLRLTILQQLYIVLEYIIYVKRLIWVICVHYNYKNQSVQLTTKPALPSLTLTSDTLVIIIHHHPDYSPIINIFLKTKKFMSILIVTGKLKQQQSVKRSRGMETIAHCLTKLFLSVPKGSLCTNLCLRVISWE